MKELKSLLLHILVGEGLGFALDGLIFTHRFPDLQQMTSPQVESQTQAVGSVYIVFSCFFKLSGMLSSSVYETMLPYRFILSVQPNFYRDRTIE